MISFVRAELRRALSRRAFRLLGAFVIGVILVSAVITFLNASTDTERAVAAARREVEVCERDRAEQERLEGPAAVQGWVCPTEAELIPSFDRTFRYADTMPNGMRSAAIAMFLVCFAMGASFIGAEWGSGSMATLLTWEPRRGRVLAAKAIAGVVLAFVAVVLALAVLAVAYLPAGAWRGTLDGIDAGFWRSMGAISLRAGGLAAFGVAVATALAMLVRNTAGAVGVGFVYGVIVDPLLGNLWRGRFHTWVLQHNLPRMLGFPVSSPQGGRFVAPTLDQAPSVTRPVILFSIYAAVLLLSAYAAFRARDVS